MVSGVAELATVPFPRHWRKSGDFRYHSPLTTHHSPLTTLRHLLVHKIQFRDGGGQDVLDALGEDEFEFPVDVLGHVVEVLLVPLRHDDAEDARAVGGEIVGGPGQLGVYLVRIKDGPLGAAAQNLRDSGTTELVEVVNAP